MGLWIPTLGLSDPLVADSGEGRMCIKVIWDGSCEGCFQGGRRGETRFPWAKFGDRGVSDSNEVWCGVCRLLIRRINLRRHIWNIHQKKLEVPTPESRCFMVDSCVQVQERKTVASDVATLESVRFIAVRPMLLVKLPVRKVAEVNPHKSLQEEHGKTGQVC